MTPVVHCKRQASNQSMQLDRALGHHKTLLLSILVAVSICGELLVFGHKTEAEKSSFFQVGCLYRPWKGSKTATDELSYNSESQPLIKTTEQEKNPLWFMSRSTSAITCLQTVRACVRVCVCVGICFLTHTGLHQLIVRIENNVSVIHPGEKHFPI